MAKHTTVSIRYQIAQKVRSWRLKRKYTIKDLAEKTGIKYYTLLRYEQGICGIPDEELQTIADALSVSLSDLLPRPTHPKTKDFHASWFRLLEITINIV